MIGSWLAFPVGILISTIVSSVGIGGGILWMPFLIIALKIEPDIAVLTSLLIQTAGKGSGSLAYFRQGKVDRKLAFFLLLTAVPGIGVGAYFAYKIRPSNIELILGMLLLITAFLFVSSGQKYDDAGQDKIELKGMIKYLWLVITMSVGSGMLSTGIGEWLIPILRSKLSLKMSRAIATCIFITFGTCVLGAIIHLIIGGKADWSVILWGVPGVMAGGQLGPIIVKKIDERLLKEIFIFVATLVGIHLIYNSY